MNRNSQLNKFQPNAPGSQTFKHNELIAVMTNADIKPSGALYVGREFAGCEVIVMVLRPKP